MSKGGHAKLADFGLAKVLEAEQAKSEGATVTAGPTRPGVILGTVAYMSPEQAEGRPVDARSDVFSFGVVLYELLAGERPFRGHSDLLVLQAILHSGPQPLAEVSSESPPELRNIVEKALEKEPGDRYQWMRDLVVDLRRVARARPVQVQPGPESQPVREPMATRRGLGAHADRGNLHRPLGPRKPGIGLAQSAGRSKLYPTNRLRRSRGGCGHLSRRQLRGVPLRPGWPSRRLAAAAWQRPVPESHQRQGPESFQHASAWAGIYG